MKPIKILYWTQLTYDNVEFNPVFFIKPSLEAVSYIKQYGFLNVPIIISGTNKLYDGFGYATFDIATMPGGCPNDFQPTELIYSISLRNTVFTVYPYEPFIGEVQIISPEMDAAIKEIQKSPPAPSPTSGLLPAMMGTGVDTFADNPNAAVTALVPLQPPPEPVIKESEPVIKEGYSSLQKKKRKEEEEKINSTTPHSYTLILCFLLLILVVLILCFYGDLRTNA
uniref:Uncharacterized protein n=1 Tax=viral metagenome TaxID=1070528 RepID=A0A6C0K196_9ZZZZ